MSDGKQVNCNLGAANSATTAAAAAAVVLPYDEGVVKGWLLKWTNYLKGYQRRWFVLQNGHLSYYRNQSEMSYTCRGSISLYGAVISTANSCTFVVSNGDTQRFHLRATSEVERQCWLTQLELAKARAIRSFESEEEEDEEPVYGAGVDGPNECLTIERKLDALLQDLRMHQDIIVRHSKALQKTLNDIEANPAHTQHSSTLTLQHHQPNSHFGGGAAAEVAGQPTEGGGVPPGGGGGGGGSRAKEVTERATVLRIAIIALINASTEYLTTAQTHGHKWIRLLEHERRQRQELQEMVETIARQHSKLEEQAATVQQATADSKQQLQTSCSKPSGGGGGAGGGGSPTACDGEIGAEEAVETNNSGGNDAEEDDENVFYDAVAAPSTSRRETHEQQPPPPPPTTMAPKQLSAAAPSTHRRTRVADKPNYPLNLWSIMKNCIGKDLSKIPMPVNFNEPLSMLQRLTEDYEYADILDEAARLDDPCEQLAYVAAFTVSAYSTTSSRTGKPFNPLLGETYECDRRTDLGWRAISEQVCHHPPMVAQHCDNTSAGWTCWQEFTMTSKFRGKYLQVIPMGTAHVRFTRTGNHFSWRKVTTTVHNIIIGNLWVDQHGDMNIVGRAANAPATGSANRSAGLKCHLTYIPYSYFSRGTQRQVNGVVTDATNTAKWIISGAWDSCVRIAPVVGVAGTGANPQYETGPARTIWQRRLPDDEAKKYYGFTRLAAQLNELEVGVAPTDSRLRPDQRLMEAGLWDEANCEKVRLEEKQRKVRRRREQETEKAAMEGRAFTPYTPVWFERRPETEDGATMAYAFNGQYWACKEAQDWSRCPDIF